MLEYRNYQFFNIVNNDTVIPSFLFIMYYIHHAISQYCIMNLLYSK